MTPAGIEPGTFRFVAQHLNHCATAVPIRIIGTYQYTLRNITEEEDLIYRAAEARNHAYGKKEITMTFTITQGTH